MEHTTAEPTVKIVRSHWSIEMERDADADEVEPPAPVGLADRPDVLCT